jgi:hypothetical protein
MQVLTTTPSLRSPQAGYEEDLGRNCAVMSAPALSPSPAAATAAAATAATAATASGASGASPAGMISGTISGTISGMISGNGASPAGLSQGWRVAGVRAGQWFDAPGLRCVTPETLR